MDRTKGRGSSRSRHRGDSPSAKRPARSILSCRIRVSLPGNAELAAFTTRHPDLRLDILDRLELGPHLVLLEIRLATEEPTDYSDEIRGLPGVRRVVRLEQTRNSSTYRVQFSGRTFVPVVRRLRMMRRFPIQVQNGVAMWGIEGPESKVHQLLRNLADSRVPYELTSIRRVTATKAPYALTDRQWDILLRSIAAGYFEVPRGTTLSELASKIGVATSTLSVTLAVIEKKIVLAHLRTAEPRQGKAL